MTLKTDMADALDDLYDSDELGEPVVYNGLTVQALVERGLDPDDKGTEVVDRAVIEVRVADVAAPAYRDPVVFSGQTWRVLRILNSDFHSHRIELMANERPKQGKR